MVDVDGKVIWGLLVTGASVPTPPRLLTARRIELEIDDQEQGWQALPERGPDLGLKQIVIFMPVDIARARDAVRGDGWVSGFHVLADTARDFGNDLQASDDGIDAIAICGECVSVEIRHERFSQSDSNRGESPEFTPPWNTSAPWLLQ